MKAISEISGSHSGKMTAFWNVTPCSLIEVDDVSEVRTASIIRAIAI